MRKLIIGLAAVSAIAALALPAGAAKNRVETFSYTGGSQAETDDFGVWIGPGCLGVGDACFSSSRYFNTRKGEKAVRVQIDDETGVKVAGVLIQEDGLRKRFCGSSGWTKIDSGKPLGVWVSANPCGTPPEGIATTGTVTTTFLRK